MNSFARFRAERSLDMNVAAVIAEASASQLVGGLRDPQLRGHCGESLAAYTAMFTNGSAVASAAEIDSADADAVVRSPARETMVVVFAGECEVSGAPPNVVVRFEAWDWKRLLRRPYSVGAIAVHPELRVAS